MKKLFIVLLFASFNSNSHVREGFSLFLDNFIEMNLNEIGQIYGYYLSKVFNNQMHYEMSVREVFRHSVLMSLDENIINPFLSKHSCSKEEIMLLKIRVIRALQIYTDQISKEEVLVSHQKLFNKIFKELEMWEVLFTQGSYVDQSTPIIRALSFRYLSLRIPSKYKLNSRLQGQLYNSLSSKITSWMRFLPK